MKVAVEIGLPVTPEEAWRALLDWEGQAAWMGDVDRVEVVSARREGVGTVIDARTRVLGVPLFTDRLEIVAWEPRRRLRMAHGGLVRGVGEWLVEPAGEGCRFRWTEEISLAVPLLGPLALLAYRPILRRLMRGSVTALRRIVERGASGG